MYKKQAIISFILCTFKIVTKSSIQILGKKDEVFCFIKSSRNRLVYCYLLHNTQCSPYLSNTGSLLRSPLSNNFIANLRQT